MKKVYLMLIGLVISIIGFGQPVPDNLAVGIFDNGANGSNASSGAYLEVPLRIKPGGTAYAASPAAEDFVLYLIFPKSDFSETDIISVVQVNPTLYGASASMFVQTPMTDIGDPLYLYAGVVSNGSGGMNLSSLSSVTNSWSYAFTIKVTNSSAVDKTTAQHRMVRIVDQTNDAFLSTFSGAPTYSNLKMLTQNQLTNEALTVLPVNLLNFSGYKNGGKNVLHWTTANEQNSQGFELQRSNDGVKYSVIGFVNSLAPGGTSTMQLSYSFDDNNPIGKKQYYRLKQSDLDGRNKLSNIVMIKGDKPTLLGIGGLFPNPANTQVNVIIDAPKRDKVTVMITDMAGKTVIRQQANVDLGSNTVPVDVAKLAGGSYLVKLTCQSSDCETAAAKFNKQ